MKGAGRGRGGAGGEEMEELTAEEMESRRGTAGQRGSAARVGAGRGAEKENRIAKESTRQRRAERMCEKLRDIISDIWLEMNSP